MTAHKKLGTVIFPAFMLQRQIRLKAMTKRFWAKATKKREKEFGGNGTVDDLIELYQKMCAEKVEYDVLDADIEDDVEENDEAEQKRLLAELEELRKAKEEERKNWAKSQSLEFVDGEDAPSANGLLIAMASKRLQAKIYHEPREGSWWAENPDVKGPRPPGQRPCSAKFKKERQFTHEDEPQVIIDRGVADLMTSVDRARIRGKRGVNRARRTVQSARSTRKEIDTENTWKPHVPYYVHMLVKHPLRLARIATPKVYHSKEIENEMTDNQRKVVAYIGSGGNKTRLKSPPRRVYKGSEDGSSNQSDEDDLDDVDVSDTPLGKALYRDRSSEYTRKRSMSPQRRRTLSPKRRPASAGPTTRRSDNVMISSALRPKSGGLRRPDRRPETLSRKQVRPSTAH